MSAQIVIRADREKPILNQHPWIFSGAISEIKGDPQPGEIVTVVTERNRFLARGYWNAKSQIQVRILSWHDEPIDDEWWARAIASSIDRRPVASDGGTRLINAENDFIPGLIVDHYAGFLVLQALTYGIDQRKPLIAQILNDLIASRGIYERSDIDVRAKEGLKQVTGVLTGEEPPPTLVIREGDHRFHVDVRKGHKTGFYLDQAYNRSLTPHYLDTANPSRLLNLFSFTGAFSLWAAPYDVHAINVDASRDALELAEAQVALNPSHIHPNYQSEYIQADVFDYLRDQVEEKQQYDLVICDPPKFAQNAQQIERAARGYKDLNLNSFKLVRPGGYLMTFSCSGAVTPDLFQKIVFGALADSGRTAQIVRHLHAAEDHPVALTFPEGMYLKGLLLRVY
jgi:23S rRNA (cytosine1962-C5)-methyltransferase